jgi:hypothetical protein
MLSEQDLLDLALGERKAWLDYLASVPQDELAPVEEALSQLAEHADGVLNRLRAGLTDVQYQIKKRDKQAEKARRKVRRAGRLCSLREFLMASLLDRDILLRDLQFCTKSGASVLLEGLFFKTPAGEKQVKSANEAKLLFQQGPEPRADWNLHYVRDDQPVAGFGWDRPFLDQIFVLPHHAEE